MIPTVEMAEISLLVLKAVEALPEYEKLTVDEKLAVLNAAAAMQSCRMNAAVLREGYKNMFKPTQ